MPPPLQRQGGTASNTFGFGELNPWYPTHAAHGRLESLMPTPSNHRTQLGPTGQPASRLGTGGHRNPANALNRDLQHHTPGQRQSLAGLNLNSVNRNGLSGYGMSAGMKVGRQQGELSRFLRSSSPRILGNFYADYYSLCSRITAPGNDTFQPRSAWCAIWSPISAPAFSTPRRFLLLITSRSGQVFQCTCCRLLNRRRHFT